MPDGSPRKLPFLKPGAATAELIRSSARNHVAWFTAGAVHGGGEVVVDRKVRRMITPHEVVVPFPRMGSDSACEIIDEIAADCRRRQPNIVGVWSLTPTRPRDLGLRLMARGFSIGWKPHWMAMDFRRLPADYRTPEPIKIAVDDEADWNVHNLPYCDLQGQVALRAMALENPRPVYHLVARVEGRVVGHSVIYLSRGGLGVAGIYNVGVVPERRRQGIGKALMIDSCKLARSLGCQYALLNSAADEFYTEIGFESLGWGQTWWMNKQTLMQPPPTADQVQFIEAIGRGDVAALNDADIRSWPADLDVPLPNGMMPVEVAVACGKPAAARWLVEHGARLDLRVAWDLGWKDQIPDLIARRADLIDRRLGQWNTTPLHDAVWRGDIDFVRTLLDCRPDLDIKDTGFNSTPLGWARHFNRTAIIALLEEASKR